MTAPTANGHGASPKRPFSNGAYCPLITPFKSDDESIDHDALARQVVRLAKAGMGIVVLGTNGEGSVRTRLRIAPQLTETRVASHLSSAERSAVIKTARSALDAHPDLASTPVLAGTGTGSARETAILCAEAAEAGADYVIVVPPGYFAFTIGKDKEALKTFFNYVFDRSPVPVMIYNFPGAASGIDLDSDFIIELSEHQNCFGVKVISPRPPVVRCCLDMSIWLTIGSASQLTCAGIGKGHRIAAHTQSKAYKARHSLPFVVLPGYSDYLLSAIISRQSGCITGTGTSSSRLAHTSSFFPWH
jgi:dihydrodipicolinate synthase/N-acetylneuraminate lyase